MIRIVMHMKGFLPAAKSVEMIGLILISLISFYVILIWTTQGYHVQSSIEQGSLMYTISGSVNALSTTEEGEATRYLRSYFDIIVECDGACRVSTAAYNQDGKRMKESDSVEIMGDIVPVRLEKVNKITLTKERGKKVILTGDSIADVYSTSLDIEKYPPLCIIDDEKSPEIRNIIKDVSSRYYGVDEEIIAAIIKRESSWNPDAYRYEPGFQIRYLEGKSQWMSDPAWIKEGEGQSLEQWFSSHTDRSGEKTGLTYEQINLPVQTRVSASYGLMQVLYTTAVITCGYKGDPEGLKDPKTNIECGAKVLMEKLGSYKDLAEAVSAYNGGKPIWKENPANKIYTEQVLGYYNAYNACKA